MNWGNGEEGGGSTYVLGCSDNGKQLNIFLLLWIGLYIMNLVSALNIDPKNDLYT